MTIGKRLVLGFLVILGLFALNLAFSFFSDQQRGSLVEKLGRAIGRQLLISNVKQTLGELNRQVDLTRQVFQYASDAGEGLEEAQIQDLEKRLAKIRVEIQEIKDLTEPGQTALLDRFENDFNRLAESWLKVYESFGVDQDGAIEELETHAGPLSRRLMDDLLGHLLEQESRGVKDARGNYDEISASTSRRALLGVVVSALVAILVAYGVSRHLVRGLKELQDGAARIGAGKLDERISVKSRDELGELAGAFNEMAENLEGAQSELAEQHAKVEEQRKVSESLLLSILPEEIAAELQEKEEVAPSYFEDVTVLFADIKGFTLSTEKLAAEELVHLLNDYFTAFDEITTRYRLEKLKTIGDCYMLVAGCPRRNASHCVDAVMAAFEMLHAVAERDRPESPVQWQVRIGLHTGPVIAGVVGTKKFAFDIWGDTVNQASRMESSGVPGRINLSYRTYSRVKDFISCEGRGKILTKEKRAVEMFFANGILPDLLDSSGEIPPPAFKARYNSYFHAAPPAFPSFDPNLIAAEKARFLRHVSLFSSLDARALRRIAEIAEEVDFPAGALIFAAGDVGDSGYLVQDGEVRIHLGDEELRILEKGAYFGEMSLLSDQRRSASVTSATDSRLLRIDKEEFRKLLLRYPQAALDIAGNLSINLAELEKAHRQQDLSH